MVGALIGGYLGYRSQVPLYKTEGMVRIASELPPVLEKNDLNERKSMFEEFLASQEMVIKSRKVLDNALDDPAWKATGRGNYPALEEKFADQLTVEHPSRTELLRISFLDPDPNVAAAAVTAVINGYQTVYADEETKAEAKRLAVLQEILTGLRKQRDDLQAQISAQARANGTEDMEAPYTAKLTEKNNIESDLSRIRTQLALAESRQGGQEMLDSMSIDQIAANGDLGMRQMLQEREVLQMDLDKLLRDMSTTHPSVAKQKNMIAEKTKRIENYAREYRKLQLTMQQGAPTPSSGTGGGGVSAPFVYANAETLQRDEKSYEKRLAQVSKELNDLNEKRMAFNDLKDKAKLVKDEIAAKTARLDQLNAEGKLGGRLSVENSGQASISPYKDARKKVGAIGALGGAMLPFIGVLLFSLYDRRYRFFEEEEQETANAPLLGILPTLPENLDDPEQAAVAAHCIHQIRVMLQLGGQSGPRSVYMITSSSPGDGKTSLTMALGLSFSASGSRTLVIDCDMTGQGLTHRLKAGPSAGLVESLVAGSVLGNIIKTKTDNLSVLPVGNAEAFDASLLSPESVRRLIEEARKSYDIVVLDTGPILGSLEASVVAAEVDGVILAVARGQQQPLVQRSIRHLRSVGANIAGIVFNRAKPGDFSRSHPSKSLRSVSAKAQAPRKLVGQGNEQSRFGPLARSVASFMPANDKGDQE